MLINRLNYNPEIETTFIKLDLEVAMCKHLKPLDKFIYSLIKNRLNLSIKNGYCDEAGNYYVHYKIKELAEIAVTCEKTISSAFKRLSSPRGNYKPLISLDDSDTNSYKIFFHELTNENGLGGTYTPNKKEKKKKSDKKAVPTPTVPVEEVGAEEVPVEILAPVGEVVAATLLPVELVDIPATLAEKIAEVSEKIAERVSEKITAHKKDSPFRKMFKKSIYLSDSEDRGMDEQPPTEDINLIISEFSSQINLDSIRNRFPDNDLVEVIWESCVEMLTYKYTTIKGQKKSLDTIRKVLQNMREEHFVDVMLTYDAIKVKVNHHLAYIKSMIYNSCVSFAAKERNEFNVANPALVAANNGELAESFPALEEQGHSGIPVNNTPNIGEYLDTFPNFR